MYMENCGDKLPSIHFPSCQSHAYSPSMARCFRELLENYSAHVTHLCSSLNTKQQWNAIYISIHKCPSAQKHNQDRHVQFLKSAKAKHRSKLMLNWYCKCDLYTQPTQSNLSSFSKENNKIIWSLYSHLYIIRTSLQKYWSNLEMTNHFFYYHYYYYYGMTICGKCRPTTALKHCVMFHIQASL